VLDIINCNDFIKDKKALKTYVKKLLKLIDMKPYGRTIIKHFGLASDITAGFSFIQLIETSLIAGHFSEKYHTAHIDCFSCKDFCSDLAADFTEKYFGGKIINKVTLERIMQ
jgi:S-adenosylmethionine/arginine decarboxylase-like enzyme